MVSELSLDRAFADKLSSSPEFCAWVLSRKKFREYSKSARLLFREQAEAKPRKKPENWWRHWWCKLPDGSESETDIFAVFEVPRPSHRIALHIEDKPPHGKFTPNQHLNYRRRGECMAGKAQFMMYSEFATILLAPARWSDEHLQEAGHFDSFISYEGVAAFVFLFEESLNEAGRGICKTST